MKLGLFALTSLFSLSTFAADLTQNMSLASGENILASSIGQTLYVFDPDQAAGKPSCNGKCAEVWPPITISDAEAAALNNPDLGVMKRDSGLNQLTFKGSPVYLFNLDRVQGDILGDGIGGVWHIITL